MPACALCGTPAPPPFRPPPAEGSPDLDGRPGEPARSTLQRWIQICSGCGACAPDVSALPPDARESAPNAAGQASPFERWATLVQGTRDEAEALLQAAWLAEDAGRDGSSLRRRAVAAWIAPQDVEGLLRLADVQRRAGLMAEAAATLDRVPAASSDAVLRIVAFERGRIAATDAGRHLLGSALRPPARTPHVSHGRPAGGFWQRLFGSGRR